MRVPVYEMDHGPCPYLENRTWITHSFTSPQVGAPLYENLLGRGWRRSGLSYYQNHCPGCRKCIPIRVPVDRFLPSKSQRRVLRRNADVTCETEESRFDQETFKLYIRYVTARHNPDAAPSEDEFRSFLSDSPQKTLLMKYRAGGKLIGAGWVDVLPDGLSSVYFAFDPQEGTRSAGTYSVMQEIEHTRTLGKSWLYLGFYVPGSRKMEYKAQFRPNEILVGDLWKPFTTDAVEASSNISPS